MEHGNTGVPRIPGHINNLENKKQDGTYVPSLTRSAKEKGKSRIKSWANTPGGKARVEKSGGKRRRYIGGTVLKTL